MLVARRKPELEALVADLEAAGAHAAALVGDVADEHCAKTAVELAVNLFGGLDVAFNNAGTLGEMGPTPDVSVAGWSDTLATNLTSAFLGAKYQIPAMLIRGRGSVVFTSTFVGYTAGLPHMPPMLQAKQDSSASPRFWRPSSEQRGSA